MTYTLTEYSNGCFSNFSSSLTYTNNASMPKGKGMLDRANKILQAVMQMVDRKRQAENIKGFCGLVIPFNSSVFNEKPENEHEHTLDA